MTSKDTDDGVPTPEAAIAYADRAALHTRIRDGHLPDIDMLLAGAPFFAGDIVRDMQVWCDRYLLSPEIDKLPDLKPLIQNLRDTSATSAHWAAEAWLRGRGHEDDADRMLVYLACMGDEAARHRLIASSQRLNGWQHDDYDRLHIAATAMGMMYGRHKSMSGYCEHGLRIIEADAGALTRFNAARDAAAVEAGASDIERLKTATAAVAQADAELQQDVLDDRAEIVRQPVGIIVVPKLPDGTSAKKDIIKSWGTKAGAELPVVQRGDVAAHRRSLVERWPHAVELIDIVLGDLAAREAVRFRPTLFVGEPGSGKSSLARAIFEQVGLPCELQPLAGVHDAALMGTSSQWHSARESSVLQLIKREGMASVGVVWDEVEKVGEGRHNGSPLDALLPMLEPDQARRYRDLALEVEVDLSMVSHFATANSLEGIPRPLIDRMRVLTMPEPGWQHLGTLTRQIIGRLARERGVDARWFAPLAEDEMDLVKAAWPGGSIRQLTRIVTTIVDGREMLMGRC